MKINKIICTFLILIIMLTSAGCSNDYLDAYIYFELENEPTTLDPQLVSSREESLIVRSIFDTLLRYNEDGEIVPSACSDYTKNGLTYTFTISNDAYWTDGNKLTAYDFEFAFIRALDPKTASPSSATLSCVKKAEALNEDTFVIELSYDDPDFLNTLTLPVTMPCNKEYFTQCKGRYGLELEFTPSCGSYYIRKWPTEGRFLIRLAKNLEYKGDFEARNMRVYFTCDERNNIDMLNENDTDFAFVTPEEAKSANESGLKVHALEDTTYMLFLSPKLNSNIRTSLIKSVKNADESYKDSFGSVPATSIAPAFLGVDIFNFADKYPYDLSSAVSTYKSAVLKINDSEKIDLSVKCYAEPTAVLIARTVTAHWQQNLGAFMNIEEISSHALLQSLYSSDEYTVLIMPMTANVAHTASYISNFKGNHSDITELQNVLGDNALGCPLFNQSSFTASTTLIKNFDKIIYSGIPDVALAIKQE